MSVNRTTFGARASTYISKYMSYLLLIKQFKHSSTQCKEVCCLTSQIDCAWICFEGVQDAS